MLSSLITFDRIVKLEADTFLGGPLRVLYVCCGVSVPQTHVRIPSHLVHGQGSKPECSFLQFASMFPDMCQKCCEVRRAERRCGWER